MNNPKISVITTVYNVASYIDKTIQSILNQTFQDWEMVFVNDCTQDDSVERILMYNDPRLVLVNNEENLGAGKSRQIGIEHAKGDFVIFLDGDDWLNEECLEKLYNAAIEQDADIVNCWMEELDEFKVAKSVVNLCKPRERFTTSLSNKLIKKTLFNKTNYSPLRLYEDINTLFRLLELSKKTVRIKYVGYVYNIRPNSLTTTKEQDYKWIIYNCLAIIENVDFFEGRPFKFRNVYNPQIVMKMYDKSICVFPDGIKKEFQNEIETIKLWCEKYRNKKRV